MCFLHERTRGHTGSISCLLLYEHQYLFSGSEDGSCRKWDLTTGDLIMTYCLSDLDDDMPHANHLLVINKGGTNRRELLCTTHGASILEWDIATGELQRIYGMNRTHRFDSKSSPVARVDRAAESTKSEYASSIVISINGEHPMGTILSLYEHKNHLLVVRTSGLIQEWNLTDGHFVCRSFSFSNYTIEQSHWGKRTSLYLIMSQRETDSDAVVADNKADERTKWITIAPTIQYLFVMYRLEIDTGKVTAIQFDDRHDQNDEDQVSELGFPQVTHDGSIVISTANNVAGTVTQQSECELPKSADSLSLSPDSIELDVDAEDVKDIEDAKVSKRVMPQSSDDQKSERKDDQKDEQKNEQKDGKIRKPLFPTITCSTLWCLPGFSTECTLFTGHQDHQARAFTLTGSLIRTYQDGRPIVCIAVSDGKYLYLGGGETVREWNVDSGQCLRSYFIKAPVYVIQVLHSYNSFDRSSHLLFTGSRNCEVREWNLTKAGNSGEPLLLVPSHQYRSISCSQLTLPLFNFFFLFFQLMSFPFRRDFEWSEEAAWLQAILPIFSFDFGFLDVPLYLSLIKFYISSSLVVLVCILVYGDVHERVSDWIGDNERQLRPDLDKRKLLERCRNIIWAILYVFTTIGFIPLSRTLLEQIDCEKTDEGWFMEEYPEVECFKGSHFYRTLMAVIIFALYLPFAIRWASLGGDSTSLRSDDTWSNCQRIWHHLVTSWCESEDADTNNTEKTWSKAKLNLGLLTHSSARATFDLVSVLCKLLLVITSVFFTKATKFSSIAFVTVSIFLLAASVYVPPFRKRMCNQVFFTARFIVLFTSILGIFVAYINDDSINWPSVVLLSGWVPVGTLAYRFSGYCLYLSAHELKRIEKRKAEQQHEENIVPDFMKRGQIISGPVDLDRTTLKPKVIADNKEIDPSLSIELVRLKQAKLAHSSPSKDLKRRLSTLRARTRLSRNTSMQNIRNTCDGHTNSVQVVLEKKESPEEGKDQTFKNTNLVHKDEEEEKEQLSDMIEFDNSQENIASENGPINSTIDSLATLATIKDNTDSNGPVPATQLYSTQDMMSFETLQSDNDISMQDLDTQTFEELTEETV